MNEQLFHVGIKAIIVNDATEVLLVREAMHDTVFWDIPGGRMEPGEDFMATLSRELQEEIGVSIASNPVHFATVLSNKQIQTDAGRVGLVLITYTVQLVAGANPTPHEAGIELQWVPLTHAAELLADKYPSEFCVAIKNLDVNQ